MLSTSPDVRIIDYVVIEDNCVTNGDINSERPTPCHYPLLGVCELVNVQPYKCTVPWYYSEEVITLSVTGKYPSTIEDPLQYGEYT